jgi:hypothetical protein
MAAGRSIFSMALSIGSEQSIAFYTSTLASGLYYCTLQTSVGPITRLITIQK